MNHKDFMSALESDLRFADSYSRLPTLFDYRYVVPDDTWLKILGREWSRCDNIGEYLDELYCSPFGDRLGRNIPEMMDRKSRKVLNELPDVVTIYRGCYTSNKWGLSWSLDRSIAERFPTLMRYRQDGQPLLVKAQIEKSKIAAVITDRNESEIICCRPKCVSISHIRGTGDGL